MTKAEIEKITAKWIDLLGLNDWKFKCTIVPAEVINIEGHLAYVEWDVPCLTAHLKVAGRIPDEQMEATIAHELIHVVLAPLGEVADAGFARLSKESETICRELFKDALEQTTRKLERVIFPRSA